MPESRQERLKRSAADAAKIVEALPSELRVAAFTKVFDLLLDEDAAPGRSPAAPRVNSRRAAPQVLLPRSKAGAPRKDDDAEVDRVHEVTTSIRDSDRFEAIESKILDQRNQLNRILLPLFIIHAEMNNAYGMTSGEISKVTKALGVPVGQPDVSNILGKGASKFVMGDRSRASGKAVRYKLSRRGVQHVEGVLAD